jgi:hypothetical protein
MRRLGALVLGSLVLLLATPARPCGAPFGPGMKTPSMNILVGYKNGVESYVFQPRFCGQAATFGLILPVPATLADNPSLAGTTLFKELEVLAAPTIVKRTLCDNPRGHADGGASSMDAPGNGTTVIDRGQVGIFDWVLLQATSAAAFTDWLDTNGFPHAASADPLFQHYVDKGWYFVAFRVTASDEAPPPTSELCGDLGPIRLSFATPAPVVPTRIAAAASEYSYYINWTLFGLAAGELGVTSTEYSTRRRFSGVLSSDLLAAAPAVSALATAGDRLVKIDLGFYSTIGDDLPLGEGAANDFRDTEYRDTYIDCGDGGVLVDDGGVLVLDDAGQIQHLERGGGGGCAVGGVITGVPVLTILLASLAGLGRRRRNGGRSCDARMS